MEQVNVRIFGCIRPCDRDDLARNLSLVRRRLNGERGNGTRLAMSIVTAIHRQLRCAHFYGDKAVIEAELLIALRQLATAADINSVAKPPSWARLDAMRGPIGRRKGKTPKGCHMQLAQSEKQYAAGRTSTKGD